jgi:hypothetical protein
MQLFGVMCMTASRSLIIAFYMNSTSWLLGFRDHIDVTVGAANRLKVIKEAFSKVQGSPLRSQTAMFRNKHSFGTP